MAIDTHTITTHIIRLSVKEGCLKINVKNVRTFTGCHLATHPKSGSADIPSVCPGNLSAVSDIRLKEVTLSVRVYGEHPSSCHVISRLNLPPIEIKNLVANVLLQQTVCSILVLLELMLSSVHGISFWLLFLLLLRK